MLLLDANVFFTKHCFAALYAVFIVMPYQTSQFLVDTYIQLVKCFFLSTIFVIYSSVGQLSILSIYCMLNVNAHY